MHRDFDTALLRAFGAVVETGSVTAAAALLNLTQAAVSQQLKRLEELFGTELFERHHRRLTLRPDGERLLPDAHRLVDVNDEVVSAMSAPAYEGEVRLGAPHDIVGPYLPAILRRFDKAWPRVRVSLKCTTTPQLLELLRRGSIDLTLTTEQRCGPGGKTLLEDDLVWAGASNGTAHQRDPLPVSLGDEKCEFRRVVLKALGGAGRDWRPVCEVSSMERCSPRSRQTWRSRRCCAPRSRITCRRSRATAACRACRNSSSTYICRRHARARPRSSSPATSPRNSRPTPMAVAGMGAPAVCPPPPDASNRARAWCLEEWARPDFPRA